MSYRIYISKLRYLRAQMDLEKVTHQKNQVRVESFRLKKSQLNSLNIREYTCQNVILYSLAYGHRLSD